MKRDEAHYFLKEVFDDIKMLVPELKFGTYRDGGSVSFSIPTEGYDNIVLLAPVSSTYNSERTRVIETRIDHADILKSGCIRFEDSYKKENVLETISLEDRNFMLGDMCFDREKTKQKLVKTIKIRLEL